MPAAVRSRANSSKVELGSLGLVFAVALLFGLWLTTQRRLLHFDWDNAAHLIDLSVCSGNCYRFTTGYTAHLALLPLYALGALLSAPFGGGTLDGFRLVNAAYVAAATVALGAIVRRFGLDLFRTLLLCAVWLTSFNVCFLLGTLEDDCVSLGMQASLLWLMLRSERVTASGSAVAGALAAVAALTNYAMIVWLPVVLVWAVCWQRQDSVTRAKRGLSALAAFAFAILGYWSWVAAADPVVTWARFGTKVSSPPNRDLMNAATRWGWPPVYLGLYVPMLLLPERVARAIVPANVALYAGAAIIVALIAGMAWPWRRLAATTDGRRISLLCFVLVVCCLPPALKDDTAIHERLLTIPFVLATLIGLAMLRASGKPAAITAVVLASLVALQIGRIAAGPVNGSWLAKFDAVRSEQPTAPTHLIAESELGPTDYDKIAAARLEQFGVLSPDGAATKWRRPPAGIVLVADYCRSPIRGAWLSPQARALAAKCAER